MLSVTITSLAGALVIQDPAPVNGIFSQTVPAGGAKTFTCTLDIWARIAAKVEQYRAAGLCTVLLTEATPAGTAAIVGPNTTYNRADFSYIDNSRTVLATITSPFLYKGAIAVNTSFPLVALVQAGWVYTITADVTDNAGVTYTNTGLAFLSGDEIAWSGSTWVRVGQALTNPLQYKGTITLAADFPEPAATPTTGVKTGHCYLIAAAVIDNDATKTNTNGVFTTGDTIQWNGAGWTIFAPQNAMHIRGPIGAAADFPTLALVKIGHTYRITAAVTDNDATKTNTGQVFKVGDIITWYSGVVGWLVISRPVTATLGLDILDAVITVADAAGGATDSALTVALQDLLGAASTKVSVVKIIAQDTQYAGMHDLNANVTFGTATAGSILASGSGWAVVKTSAVGAFACTATNAADETVYFTVCAAEGGHDALAAGTIIRGCVPDAATWAA
jgi:hypothetical protein